MIDQLPSEDHICPEMQEALHAGGYSRRMNLAGPLKLVCAVTEFATQISLVEKRTEKYWVCKNIPRQVNHQASAREWDPDLQLR